MIVEKFNLVGTIFYRIITIQSAEHQMNTT